MVTSELSAGARFAELAGWPQHERDLAAETIYRFVFRSLYEVRAFNGDPHPGNYLFHGGGPGCTAPARRWSVSSI
jgi:predicted unusual protein kinase regulating ubiquinone biosynthesis (AarF/ABC1/UbiB family)